MNDWRKHPRYRTFSRYFRERYGHRVWKVSVDAGFTCPNIDGTKARGGCTFCRNKSFVPDVGPGAGVLEQIQKGKRFLRKRTGAEKFLAYFQAHTNTYAPVEELRQLYTEALTDSDVIGLAVGTRADCLSDPVLDLLEELAREREVWLEIGLQTMHDTSLEAMNRAETLADFEDAMLRAQGRNLQICVHLILGWPGETREMMCQTAEYVASTQAAGVKIHHLYVAAGTEIHKSWKRGEVPLFETGAEYVPVLADVIERLHPEMVVQRLMGEGRGESLIAPHWPESKQEIRTMLIEELARRETHQGARHPGRLSFPVTLPSATSVRR